MSNVAILFDRRVIVGGSTIAAAAGVSQWTSRIELADRIFRPDVYADDDHAEAMAWGNRIQPLIFEALRGRDVLAWEAPEVDWRDHDHPWLVGHPDGFTEDGDVVEAKLTGSYRGYHEADELPIGWQAQVQTYMRLAEVERAIVAVNVAGTRLIVVEVGYDERAATRLVELAEEFVGYVRDGRYPPADGSDSARKALGYIFPSQTEGARYVASGALWEACWELREWREAEARCKARVQAIENRLKEAMGDCETLVSPSGEEVATWKQQTSRRIDTKRLREQRPELAGLFETETTTRVWRMR